MRLKAWEELPDQLKTESVRPYYDALRKKQGALFCKRLTDLLLSAALLVVLSPVLLVLAICIKIDSPGTVFFRQVRVTQYGREFRIFKFRTMVQDAPSLPAPKPSSQSTWAARSPSKTTCASPGWAGCCAAAAWTSCRSSSTSLKGR